MLLLTWCAPFIQWSPASSGTCGSALVSRLAIVDVYAAGCMRPSKKAVVLSLRPGHVLGSGAGVAEWKCAHGDVVVLRNNSPPIKEDRTYIDGVYICGSTFNDCM